MAAAACTPTGGPTRRVNKTPVVLELFFPRAPPPSASQRQRPSLLHLRRGGARRKPRRWREQSARPRGCSRPPSLSSSVPLTCTSVRRSQAPPCVPPLWSPRDAGGATPTSLYAHPVGRDTQQHRLHKKKPKNIYTCRRGPASVRLQLSSHGSHRRCPPYPLSLPPAKGGRLHGRQQPPAARPPLNPPLPTFFPRERGVGPHRPPQYQP